MILTIETPTTDTFAPFGTLVQQPKRATDANGPGWQWWDNLACFETPDSMIAIGYLHLQPSQLAFDWAERHMYSQEMIIPLGGPCLIYVAPALYPDEPAHMPGLDQFRVFQLDQGQAVILDSGVWHGAPVAVDQAIQVIVLLKQNTGETDKYYQSFSDRKVTISPVVL